jgi:hypothetical protein
VEFRVFPYGPQEWPIRGSEISLWKKGLSLPSSENVRLRFSNPLYVTQVINGTFKGKNDYKLRLYRQQYIKIVNEKIVFFIVHSLTTVNTILLQRLLHDHYFCMHLASIEHFHHQKHKPLIQRFHYDALFVFENRGLKFCFKVSEQRATSIFRTNESRSEFRFGHPEGGISTLLRNVGINRYCPM